MVPLFQPMRLSRAIVMGSYGATSPTAPAFFMSSWPTQGALMPLKSRTAPTWASAQSGVQIFGSVQRRAEQAVVRLQLVVVDAFDERLRGGVP